MADLDLTPRDAVDVAALALEYARKVEAGTATSDDISTLVCHLSTLNEDLPGLLRVSSSELVEPRKIEVHFRGGPWSGQTYEVDRVVGPVFAVGDEIGNHYWLDGKSDPPTYIWDER